jgi:hypothetical protein
MADPGRARRWTKVQVVAWLAFRSVVAVRAASQFETGSPANKNPYLTLAAAAQIGDLRLVTGKVRPGVRVRKAMRVLEGCEKKRKIVADASGRYRASEVRALCPSREGPGLAPAPRPMFSPADIHRLGWLFLTSQRSNGMGWCRDNDLVTTHRQYSVLRKLALEWALIELSERSRLSVSLRDSKKPLGADELRECEENLRSWTLGGRPRNKSKRV